MASISGSSKHSVQMIASLVNDWRRSDAQSAIEELIASVGKDELLLLSPELLKIINSGFEKKRKRHLSQLLEYAMSSPGKNEDKALQLSEESKRHVTRYSDLLQNLQEQHIFQWTTFYTDVISFIVKDLFSFCKENTGWQRSLESVSALFADHAKEISKRGVDYSMSNGLPLQIVHSKSMGGFQKFLLIGIQAYIKQRDVVSNALEAKLIWDINSCIISGIVNGYAETLGWGLILNNSSWLHALGFLSGTDAANLLHKPASNGHGVELFSTLVPALTAFELIASTAPGSDFFLPRFSRIIPGAPLALEITATTALGAYPQEITVACFFDDVINEHWDLKRADSMSTMASIVCLNNEMQEWVTQGEFLNLVDVTEVGHNLDHCQQLAAIIKSRIIQQVNNNIEANQDRYLVRNYAKDFPLEDPNHRQMYMVDRYSVKKLLEKVSKNTGLHLWCSVRRSGKTTAALNLGENAGRAVVVFQTMDHTPHSPQYTIFENRIRIALTIGAPLASDFFEGVINECLFSTADSSTATGKKIFILDEYESFFGLVAAMTKRDPDLRYLVSQPLLSQMVSFSTTNLIIFMGQRPDAHYVLSAQNQLSPLVKQFDFPLFEHIPSELDSEFTELIRRVLSSKIKFDHSFVEAVYDETSGHPFLTVNLLVDLCDWLIENKVVESNLEITAMQFAIFVQQRLTPSAIITGAYYSFFVTMLSEYLSEDSREHEPWLYSIAMVLKLIATRHPKILQCSLIRYKEIADIASAGLSISRDQLLSSAAKANFLKSENGSVMPAIRLMGRLASCATPRI